MPRLRSGKALPSRNREDLDTTVESESDGGEISATQTHINGILEGYERKNKELRRLRSENRRLKRKSEHNVNLKSFSPEVKALQHQVLTLTKDCQKLRKRVRRLKRDAAAAEVKDLGDQANTGAEDTTAASNKAMKEVQALVTQNSIEEDEECSICTETLKIPGTSTLPCDHVYCDICISNLVRPLCPNCRKGFVTEEIEPVIMTAGQQWDKLLQVVHAWAVTDNDNKNTSLGDAMVTESDMSDDEENGDAEEKVKQGLNEHQRDEPRSTSPHHNPLSDSMGATSDFSERQEEIIAGPSTPPASELPPDTGPSTSITDATVHQDYHSSPHKVKESRLQELADRKRKRLKS